MASYDWPPSSPSIDLGGLMSRETERLRFRAKMVRRLEEQRVEFEEIAAGPSPRVRQAVWVYTQVKRFAYRPDYFLFVEPPKTPLPGSYDLEQVAISVHGWAEDARHPGRDCVIRSLRVVPPFIVESQDEDHFAHWLQHVFFEMENHESREWLRMDGKIYDDPHKRDSR